MKWRRIEEVSRVGAKKFVEDQIGKAARKKEIQKNVRRARELRELLQAVAPSCPVEVASAVAVDLADLESVGSKHRRHVNKIVKLAGPRTNSQLADVLVEVEVNLLFEAQFHLSSLKTNLPNLVRAMNKPLKGKPSKRHQKSNT
jgi:hypothetical protein